MLQVLALVGAAVVLPLTVGMGIVVHELSHAVVLSLFGVRCDIDIGPDRVSTRQFGANIPRAWATVTPRDLTPETPPVAMRLSSIAPLALALPFVGVAIGILPDPLQAGNPMLTAVTIGWLACAIPSPQDFSLFWHAEDAVAEHAAESAEA